ncbi:MAG: hypothetical protein ACXIVQ_00385 [Acidimicrobiales bacterium]
MTPSRPLLRAALAFVVLVALVGCSGDESAGSGGEDGHTLTTRAPLVGAGESTVGEGTDEPAAPADGETDGADDVAAGEDEGDGSAAPSAGGDGDGGSTGPAPTAADLCQTVGVLTSPEDPVFGTSDLFATPAPAVRDAYARSTAALEIASGVAPDPVRGEFAVLARTVSEFDQVLGRYGHDLAALMAADDPAVHASFAAFDSPEYDQAVGAVRGHVESTCGLQFG